MKNLTIKLMASLVVTFLSLASFSSSTFAEEPIGNASQAKHLGNPSQKVSNHFAELMGLLNQLNQNIQKVSVRARKAQPAAVTVSIQAQPSAARGKAIFHEMQCIACHGVNGKGHEAKTNMKDERGLPIMAADLTQPSSFGNGNSRKDIFRTVMTGLNGSPMPSFVDLFIGEEGRAWDLVEYVYSLQEDTLARFLP